MTIRVAQQDDLPRLMILWEDRQVLLQQSDSRFAHPDSNRTQWEVMLRQSISVDSTLMLVDEVDSLITGFIIVDIADDAFALISGIVLDAHKYHPGVGRRLVDAVQTQLSARDVQQVAVMVPRYHAVEQAFWLALGAKNAKTQDWIKKYWELPAGCMWMTL